ncbi:hydroxymethylglutaryl-coenzyme A synthase C terminal-domain-containing protein [Entophlyctis helioformis]|nr:hydroxymethylglutaryl-coenzyme A synthase C terminal-domain-containing protein [Entophlyctis helioformis]
MLSNSSSPTSVVAGAAASVAPMNVGIHAVEIYFPKKCVDQTELEKFDGASAGKYTIGLGQTKMAFCDDREDINSICLTAVKSLMEKYNISYSQIGRLEVGTETIIDKSKSVKSVLMQLFEESGNSDVEGVDTTNACYGGTNALFNSINWLESSAYDGRYALVVAADIAVYKSGNARPTGGAGAVAILLGRDAPVVFDQGLRVSHVEHVYDFYKPDLHSEYPEVDGPLSNMCYLKALDTCYNRYADKANKSGDAPVNRSVFDFMLFHSPYTKLVQKSYARLAFNDLLRNPAADEFAALSAFASVPIENTYVNKDIEKEFMAITKADFASRVGPGIVAAKNLGNMYCGSLYGGLASLLSIVPSADLQNKRVGLFSYGSGLASSMFSFTVRGSTEHIAKNLNLVNRLESRTVAEPAFFEKTMQLREAVHNARDYEPQGVVDETNMFPGTYYLDRVDAKFRRTYRRFVL